MTALEAGGSKVVRSDWHKHISVPLQTGRGQTRGGGGRAGRPKGRLSRDGCAKAFPAHRSEKVPVIQGDVGARPASCCEEQGVLQGSGGAWTVGRPEAWSG